MCIRDRFRACSEINVKTVGIYTHEDRYSLHRYKADESYQIGQDNQPLKPYLDIDAIIKIALENNVDAIHPGYGFLSENANFAEKCEKNNIIFVGPKVSVLKSLGDKITAKTLAEKAGIQTVPGYKDEIPEDPEKFKAVARDVGYPIMIKATAGGGGRGMRVVEKEEDLITLAQITMQEAKNAFGNETIYLEKFIANPRHVEVQVVGDGKGKAIHLGTRDCLSLIHI